MGELIDPSDASIDGLIDWLGAKRRRHPSAPLSELLSNHEFDQQRLVDVACIDLMQRRRMEHAVTVEHYVKDFPCLSSDSNLLDLIDAELCIANELGESLDVEAYARRFPALAEQVRELFQLEARGETDMTSAVIDVSSVASSFDLRPGSLDAGAVSVAESELLSQSGDFSIEVLPKQDSAEPNQVSSLSQHPLDVPEWFVGGQCVASGPGRWLIRGRDSIRGVPLALKITELPALITDSQSKQILDACEAAAKVRNPSWVAPSVAAIQQRHLGVIRPWLFARPWQTHSASLDVPTQLRNLASVAFAVESAHRLGATHGGIHLENLLIDHDGKVQILDAGASRMGLERWMNPISCAASQEFASLEERKSVDTQDVIKLIAAASVEWEQRWATDLVAELRRIADQTPEGGCGVIGQSMIGYADSPIPHSEPESNGATHLRSWRRRLAHWLTKNE